LRREETVSGEDDHSRVLLSRVRALV
jgi:hypothetical protein